MEFKTSSACPLTLTFLQDLISWRFSSNKKVDLSIPIYFFPYIDFSTQTLKVSHIFRSSSEANFKFRLYLEINFWCFSIESLDTPIIVTFFLSTILKPFSIFLTKVSNPEEFGVVELVEGEIISIQEKPSKPKSDYIAVGLYLFDNLCFEYIKSIQKSDRGEYEITSLIEKYLDNNALNFQFTNGWWVDAGTPEAIKTIEKLI